MRSAALLGDTLRYNALLFKDLFKTEKWLITRFTVVPVLSALAGTRFCIGLQLTAPWPGNLL